MRNFDTVNKLRFTGSTFLYPFLFVLAIWFFYWLEIRFDIDFKPYGLRPRNWIGLRGILFTPLIHGSLSHLAGNSLSLFFLSMALFYFYQNIAWRVLVIGGLLTGLLTWLIGVKGTVHIGASGIIYVLVSFLFFKGIWSKNFRLIALALIVVFLYGSLIWGIFPQIKNVSWEGHLSGFISGLLLSFYYKGYQVEFHENQVVERPISRREAEFLKHFDEKGNFIPASEMKEKQALQSQDNTLDVEIRYRPDEKSKPNQNPD